MYSFYLQPDRVSDFCKRNKLQLIIRAHECVMDGFERFAQGQLITLFSATNYCGKQSFFVQGIVQCSSFCSLIWLLRAGTANNAGAILVVGRGLVVVPKLIHPLPPPLQSPETSPERVIDDTWMQVNHCIYTNNVNTQLMLTNALLFTFNINILSCLFYTLVSLWCPVGAKHSETTNSYSWPTTA